MNIGFDVTWMNTENRRGGVFQYALRVIFALAEHTEAKVVAIISKGGRGVFDGLKGHKNFKEIILGNSTLFDVVASEKIDVIHTPIQMFVNLTFSVPMVTTLHDMQHFHYPEFFSKEEIEARNFFYKHSAEFADRVIVSYQHVKEDIVKFYGISQEKIDVCPLGIEPPRTVTESESRKALKKYQVPERYIFYSANTWPHKNHLNLIRALKLLHEKYALKISLVCTGQKYPEFFPRLDSEVKNLGLRDFVKFLGYIPEKEARALLKNAILVAIPTLYEAGSFPLMEAMAYEVPVLCSNVTSLPETIGDSRFIFDPTDAVGVAEKIAMMLKSEMLMKENRENSRRRLKDSGWDRAVEFFIKTYSKAVEEFKNKRDFSKLENKMRNYELISNKRDELLRTLNVTLQSFFGRKWAQPFIPLANLLRKRLIKSTDRGSIG